MNVQSRNYPEQLRGFETQNTPKGKELSFHPEVVNPAKEITVKVIDLNSGILREPASPSIIYLSTRKIDQELNLHPNVSVFNEKQQEIMKAIKVVVESNKYKILAKGNLTNHDVKDLQNNLQIVTDHNADAAQGRPYAMAA